MCVKKTGLNFVDEQWVVAASASKEHASLNDYDGGWITPDALRRYMTVQLDERFDYSIPLTRCIDLYSQPPAFFIILHTLLSFFPNQFSKWFTLSINLAMFPLTLYLLWLTAKRLFNSKKKALVIVGVYALSAGAIATFVYAHIYAMSAFTVVLTLFSLLKYYDREPRDCAAHGCHSLALVYAAILLGGLTSYLYWFFAGVFVAVLCILDIKNVKRWFPLAGVALTSLITAVILWPYTVRQFFGGNWVATGAVSSLFNIFKPSKQLFDYIYNSFFAYYTPIWMSKRLCLFIFLLCVGIAVVSVFKGQKNKRISNLIMENIAKPQNKLFIAAASALIMGAYLISLISPFKDHAGQRYFFLLYPVWAMIIGCAIYSAAKLALDLRRFLKMIVIPAFIIVSLCLNGFNVKLSAAPVQVNMTGVRMEDFNGYLTDSYVIYVNGDNHIIHYLGYTFKLVKGILNYNSNNPASTQEHLAEYALEQLNYVPSGERILLIVGANGTVDFGTFTPSLKAYGYQIKKIDSEIGNSPWTSNVIYEISARWKAITPT
jgi:hypothetical protein